MTRTTTMSKILIRRQLMYCAISSEVNLRNSVCGSSLFTILYMDILYIQLL